MKKFIIIFTLLLLASCSAIQTKESPVIYFSNASTKPISNIRCVWAENEVMTLSALYPGNTRSQSFYIKKNEDFFGYVTISWQNASGQEIVREFDFKDNNLPSINNERSYDFVQFYLDQEELEIISSDAPDLTWKTQKMDRLLTQYNQAYSNPSTSVNSALINIYHNQIISPAISKY